MIYKNENKVALEKRLETANDKMGKLVHLITLQKLTQEQKEKLSKILDLRDLIKNDPCLFTHQNLSVLESYVDSLMAETHLKESESHLEI